MGKDHPSKTEISEWARLSEENRRRAESLKYENDWLRGENFKLFAKLQAVRAGRESGAAEIDTRFREKLAQEMVIVDALRNCGVPITVSWHPDGSLASVSVGDKK